jgi:hypothetical protein
MPTMQEMIDQEYPEPEVAPSPFVEVNGVIIQYAWDSTSLATQRRECTSKVWFGIPSSYARVRTAKGR